MDSTGTFRLINECIASVARLLWPLVILVLVLVFRRDLSAVLRRIRKGKLFGQEMELDPAIREFQVATEVVRAAIPEPLTSPEETERKDEEFDRDRAEVLRTAAVRPELGIIRLSAFLEREIRSLAGSLGRVGAGSYNSPVVLLRQVVEGGYLPLSAVRSLEIFWQLRNRVVHGRHDDDDPDTLRVLDIGLALLRAVKSVPHELHIVDKTNVDLYSDPDCRPRIEHAKGVILRSTTPGGAEISRRVFPTLRPQYFKEGNPVTWEWDLSRIWDNTWYTDPQTGERKKAWDTSGEFVGRHLSDV